MSLLTCFKLSVGAVFYVAAIAHASPYSHKTLEEELAAVSDQGLLAPREVLSTLAKIQATYSPLPLQQQAIFYERRSYAKMYTNDLSGALQDTRMLEELGKKHHDISIECLGVLSQSYPYWMMGKAQMAYEAVQKAEQCSAAGVITSVRAKVMMARAQIESQNQNHQLALKTAAEAVHLISTTGDDALLFGATRRQILIALAANDTPLALSFLEGLLSQGTNSTYPERMIRARDIEYTVSSAAGLTSRADSAIKEKVRLLRRLQLNQALGRTLVEYSNFQLKNKRYIDAEALSRQALMFEEVLSDEYFKDLAHFYHAIALIHLGKLTDGKNEAERIFKSAGKSAYLLTFLPEYVATLSQVGDVNASIQAAALQTQIEADEEDTRSREKSTVDGQLEKLSRLSETKTLEALNERKLRNVWLVVAATSTLAVIGLISLYARLRVVNRLLKESNQQLYTSSNRDLLTGLFNRRYLENYVAELSEDAADSNTTPAPRSGLVLLMDIDYFKQVNDTYGHAVGDGVLQVTAARLTALFRNDDIVARWGGEEFLAILPSTQASEASSIAARVLAAVSREPVVVNNVCLNVTISIGICNLGLELNDSRMDWHDVVNFADQSLYLAKQNGRNMAYGLTDAKHMTSAELASGLRKNHLEGKVKLIEVFGNTASEPAVPQRA